jgi:hypothetical protein
MGITADQQLGYIYTCSLDGKFLVSDTVSKETLFKEKLQIGGFTCMHQTTD